MRAKQTFLVLAFVMVATIAALSGIAPQWFARSFFGLDSLDVNVAHVCRAVAGLYLGLGLFWLYAAFREEHRRTAMLTVVVFAVGHVIGRNVSILVDGMPATIMLFYTGLELAIVPVAYWIYRLPD